MYPSGQLRQIEARKALIRARIALHRAECAADIAELARPLEQLDQWRGWLSSLRMLWPVGAAVVRDQLARRRDPERRGWRRWVPFGFQMVRSAARVYMGR